MLRLHDGLMTSWKRKSLRLERWSKLKRLLTAMRTGKAATAATAAMRTELVVRVKLLLRHGACYEGVLEKRLTATKSNSVLQLLQRLLLLPGQRARPVQRQQ